MNMKLAKPVYRIWLAALAVLLAACSLEYQPIVRAGLGTVRSTCFLLFGMADLLSVLMLMFDFSPTGRENGGAIDGRAIEGRAIDGRAINGGVIDGRTVNGRAIDGGVIMQGSDGQGRSRFLPYIWRLAAFVLATVLFWCYCFWLEQYFTTNSTMDALVAGGLLCAAAVLSR
ncbi:MAG: hypothetical protein LUI13_00505 [Lachnospiraceae bacterium]|nr:hypothetical protein [Lachnospiraceae bacterium]